MTRRSRRRELIEDHQDQVLAAKRASEWNPTGPQPVFYLLTEPDTARKIADRGFADAGVWSAQSTVTLLDHVPGDIGGGILRVSLPPAAAQEAMRREASDPGEEYRKFLVPLELLRDAYVVHVGQ